jgi:hypothetical protein
LKRLAVEAVTQRTAQPCAGAVVALLGDIQEIARVAQSPRRGA